VRAAGAVNLRSPASPAPHAAHPDRIRPVASTPDTLVLRGGSSSLALVPALGGKIASLRLAGREWLWTSDVIAPRVPDERTRADDAASYVEIADTGGYDECFPTVGACVVPAGVPRFGGLRLPDHGELWSQQPAVTVGDDGSEATVAWVGRRMPYEFVRAVRVEADGRVTMRYAATNRGEAPLPFLWSAHPLLALTERTRVHLPHGARLRVDAAHGLGAHDAAAEQAWPTVRVGGATLDASHPAAVGDGYACKLFLDLPAGPVVAAVEEDGARLEVAMDGGEVTHFGLWLNNGGWTPFAGGRPYRNLAFEPCIGAPDSLADALGRWDAAAWLAPGETRRWTLVWLATGA